MPALRVRTLITGVAGSPAYTNFHFVGAPDDAASAVAATRGFFNVARNVIVRGTTIQVQPEVTVIDLASGNAVGVVTVASEALQGNGIGNMQSRATNGLIRWRTGAYIGGRGVRGRTFIPYIPEGYNANGVPTGEFVNTLNGAANVLIGDENSQFAVLAGGPGAPPYICPPVSSGDTWTQWSVLRSRRD